MVFSIFMFNIIYDNKIFLAQNTFLSGIKSAIAMKCGIFKYALRAVQFDYE